MINPIKEIWKDPVWSKIIANIIWALLVLIPGLGSAYFLSAWPPTKATLNQALLLIQSNTLVPNWLLAIIFLLFLRVILVKTKEWLNGNKPRPAFESYTKDYFFGLLWEWRYSGNQINDLQSLCPKCKYQIFPKPINPYTSRPKSECTCSDCGYSADTIEGTPEELNQKVKLKIEKALRTNKWAEKENG